MTTTIDATYDAFGDGCIQLTRTVRVSSTRSKTEVLVLTPEQAAQAIQGLERALTESRGAVT